MRSAYIRYAAKRLPVGLGVAEGVPTGVADCVAAALGTGNGAAGVCPGSGAPGTDTGCAIAGSEALKTAIKHAVARVVKQRKAVRRRTMRTEVVCSLTKAHAKPNASFSAFERRMRVSAEGIVP